MDIRPPQMIPPSATSCRWRHTNTSWNHVYKGIAENGCTGGHLVPVILQWPPKIQGPKRLKRSRISGPYGLFQTKGETCAKFGSDRFRNVNLCKFHTYIPANKHSCLYIRYCCITKISKIIKLLFGSCLQLLCTRLKFYIFLVKLSTGVVRCCALRFIYY